VLLTYQLGWSEVYPNLSLPLLSFLFLTFVVAALLAAVVSADVNKRIDYNNPALLPHWLIYLLVLSFSADLINTPQIPLLAVLGGDVFNGTDIGVPTLHVINGTFGSVFSVIRFTDFLYTRRPRFLIEAFAPIVFFALIIYRGPISVILATWGFVFLIKDGLTLKRGISLAAIAVAGLFLFGLFGDLREGSSEVIQKVGRPSAAFKASGVPAPYLWTYIYLTSPLANLELAVANPSLEGSSVAEFAISEMLPDFISKRVLPQLASYSSLVQERVFTPEVSPGLNVATLYGRAFVMLRWTGATILFAQLCLLILVYVRLIRDSPYRLPCLALLNVFVLFCTFHNMLSYTGLILQLVWPLLLPRPRAWPQLDADGRRSAERPAG
jgi:hypothetical protein